MSILKQLEEPWQVSKPCQQNHRPAAHHAHHKVAEKPAFTVTEEAINAAIDQVTTTPDACTSYGRLRRLLADGRSGLAGDLHPFWRALMLALAEKRWFIPLEMEAEFSEETLGLLAEHTLLAAAVNCDNKAVPEQLAARLPCREMTRPLLRRLFRQMPPGQRHRILEKRWDQQFRQFERVHQAPDPSWQQELLLLLNLESGHPSRPLSPERWKEWWQLCGASEKCLRALLQWAEENPVYEKQVVKELQGIDFFKCSPRLQQAMINYCATAAEAFAGELLAEWRERLTLATPVANWLREYVALGEACWKRRQTMGTGTEASPEKRKLTLAQFMFYGDLLMPGKSNSGGIATLLHALGDTLVQQPEIQQVYTFMMIPCGQSAATIPLITLLSPGHTLVRVPVFFNEACSPRLFAEKEDDLLNTLNHMMTLLAIEPDIYHMRYSDNASLAAVLLAAHRGKHAVFTLTPDPHRHLIPLEISSPEKTVPSGALNLVAFMEAQVIDLLEKLNKVAVADEIISRVQGIVGIGTEAMSQQLLHYFPQIKAADVQDQSGHQLQRFQLLEKKHAGQKRPVFQMIPEGIRLYDEADDREAAYQEFELKKVSSQVSKSREVSGKWGNDSNLQEIFTDESLRHCLSPQRLSLPLILTVGRLDPVKGHEKLLKAWGTTALWRHMNLVFIGGDLQSPDEKEQTLLTAFDDFIQHHSQLQGAFCHLPRMENKTLRQLQRQLAAIVTPNEAPAVIYVAPSQKEEFGLSIIEAMSAGLPVIAPRAGGVGSYITHGDNGYLMDTSSEKTIGRFLTHLLLEELPADADWRALANRGKNTVTERFDIQQVARRFAVFYGQLPT
ncbi:glycosyltransferase family 4 protein [Anoxynatronum sibiricum]